MCAYENKHVSMNDSLEMFLWEIKFIISTEPICYEGIGVFLLVHVLYFSQISIIILSENLRIIGINISSTFILNF